MNDRDDRRGRGPDDLMEVRDSGETLEAALEQEEANALAAAEDKIHSIQKDLAELKDRHLRKLAEFENLRKRSERDKAEYYRQALASFLGEFLDIADNFQRALDHAKPEELESDFGQGIELIHKQFQELWKRFGLKEVDTSGDFDPNMHEAVATEVNDVVPPQTIVQVLQKGYMLQDRLVRPALVKVAVRENPVAAGQTQSGSDEAL